VIKIKCFHGGASFNAVGINFDRLDSKNEIIRADVTDAWFKPAPNVINALSEHLSWLLKNSPPTNSEGLVNTISEARGIPKENLIVGGGSSDLMFAFFPNYKFDSVSILDPMYGEYTHIFENVLKKDIRRIKQKPEAGFKINVNELVQGCAGSDMLAIVNPNSPTGVYLTKIEVKELLSKIPKETILFIDETYIDYVGRAESVEALVVNYPNLVVLKSMSKVYALSGARVGYLAAHSTVIDMIKPFIPPWSVGLIGQVAGIEALKSEDYYLEKISKTNELRKEFVARLQGLPGARVYPGCANFILIGIKETGKLAQDVCEELIQKNIYIRNATSMSSQFNQDFIRVAVKDEKSNDKIYLALKEVLEN
jgi:histidinol-phosphate/aromatic aminotransferase/cobyric acid decarboxylase-like protein